MDKFIVSHKRDELEKQAIEANTVIFGNRSFRDKQLEVILSVLEKKDTFVVMPTGGGKTLCYTLPAVLSKGLTIVITPLLSLMEDQVSKLITLNNCGGIPAAYLSSTCTASQITDVMTELRRAFHYGQEPFLKLLYLTPERLLHTNTVKEIIDHLYQNEFLARIVIDEAHCVSSWGHDFRKDYQALNYFKEKYPDVPILALTATARSKVIKDTCKILKIENCALINSGFDRPNLIFEVRPKKKKSEDTLQEIVQYIKTNHRNDTGIIYCMTQKDCESTSDYLRDNGLQTCDYYHAGQSKGDRKMIQSAWSNGSLKVICATIAYGMGIDKPNVRFVIHLSLAKSLEGYYQEAGRAGRDGNMSKCIIYYRKEDVSKLAKIMKMPMKGKKKSAKDKDKDLLQEMQNYCEETATCRREIFASYFVDPDKKRVSFNCKNHLCDNCRNNSNAKSNRNTLTLQENKKRRREDIDEEVEWIDSKK